MRASQFHGMRLRNSFSWRPTLSAVADETTGSSPASFPAPCSTGLATPPGATRTPVAAPTPATTPAPATGATPWITSSTVSDWFIILSTRRTGLSGPDSTLERNLQKVECMMSARRQRPTAMRPGRALVTGETTSPSPNRPVPTGHAGKRDTDQRRATTGRFMFVL